MENAGKYRKQMKRGYSKVLYNQRNKDETIISVIKRLFGEHITSRLVRTQNRELSFRCIAYNTHRLTNLTIITWFLQSLSNYVMQSSMQLNRFTKSAIITKLFCYDKYPISKIYSKCAVAANL